MIVQGQGLTVFGQIHPVSMLPDFLEKVKQLGRQIKGEGATGPDLTLDPDVPTELFDNTLDK